MRVENAPADMKYILTRTGYEISRSPVKMKFERRCGTIVEFDRRGEKCLCSICQ